ncbi:MAG: hypothetical protein H7233_01245 [Pseudorhodobacter sp.]|nr:hypothetical protein [Frankiaceae bacterium]
MTAATGSVVLRVALPSDLASLRITVSQSQYGPGDVGGVFANDVPSAVAFVVERTGATAPVGRLLAVSGVASSLAVDGEVGPAVASVLAQEGLAVQAARLAARCWAADDRDVAWLGDIYYIALLPQVGDLAPEDRVDLIRAMRRRAAQDADTDPGHAGPAHCNLASCLNAFGLTWEALEAMDAAVALDRRYARRDYFYRERGGLRWTAGGHADAAADYRTALALGGDPGEIVPLLADALIHAGEYAAAGDVLDDWEPTGHDHDRMAVVMRTAVGEILATTGTGRQDRTPAAGTGRSPARWRSCSRSE